MKTKAVPILFVLAIGVIAAVFFITRHFISDEVQSGTRAKVVTLSSEDTPKTDSEKQTGSASVQNQKFDSFVELQAGETLISSLTLDLNDDGLDDDVIVVRKSTSPDFIIVPALYNPQTAVYDRIVEIPTKISKARTFSYTGMDITGEHKNALIVQGSDDDENFLMQIYQIKEDASGIRFVKIGDFTSDGTIFIQQTERSESYALSLSKGEPFSVWVYKSDKSDENASGANQLQQEYKWNASAERYELAREIKVVASRLAARELSRIQDGTVETFADFLSGLWYKTSNEDSEIRYIYFSYPDRELILLHGDTQEVFEWDDSKLRHNGIYLSTVNSTITTLQRRFDISLISVDEIRVTLRDYINLDISESTYWDGKYKKLSIQSTFDDTSSAEVCQIIQEFEKTSEWTSADTFYKMALKDSVYTLTGDGKEEKGIYSVMKIGPYDVIEFRPDLGASVLNHTYSMEFGTKVIEETVKKQTVEKIVPDTDTIIFTPVKITPTDCFATDGKIFTFTRQ